MVLSRTRIYFPFLDSLRGLAATYVVVGHALEQVDFKHHAPAGITATFIGLFEYSHFAVNLFIVLSGFSLMIPVIGAAYRFPGGVGGYLKKRTMRIVPPYLLAILFSLVLINTLIGQKTGTLWDVAIPVNRMDILTHLLMVHDISWATSPKINHALWSISVEYRIYFLFPLMIVGWRKWGPVATALITGMVTLAITVALYRLNRSIPLNLEPWGICPHYILLFFLGALGAELALGSGSFARLFKTFPWGWMAIGLAVLTMVLSLEIFRRKIYLFRFEWIDLLTGLCFLSLLVHLTKATMQGRAGRFSMLSVLSLKPLVFIGTMGYSIYLIHAPLLQVFTEYIVRPLGMNDLQGFLFLSVAGTILIYGCAYVFYTWCEKPFHIKSKLLPVRTGLPEQVAGLSNRKNYD